MSVPIRFLCVQHKCPSRLKCGRYVMDVPGMPVQVCQLPAGISRCKNWLAIPANAKLREVK